MSRNHDDALIAADLAGGKFSVINAIAKRSRQIVGGAPPLVDDLGRLNRDKPAMTALREIALGRVRILPRK